MSEAGNTRLSQIYRDRYMAVFISIFLCFIIVALLLPDSIRKKGNKVTWMILGGLALLVLLMVSGKLNIFTALGGVLVAGLTKLPQLFKYWSILQRVRPTQKNEEGAGQGNAREQRQQWNQQQKAPRPTASDMSREQALKVLGLKDGATRKDVTMAYKRLMQKLHPDRGGSEVLAAEVNRARDVLLK